MDSNYIQQLNRVRRFRDRIQDQNRDYYEDDAWSFFQNCWHLKDWIKNDDNLDQKLRDKIVSNAETVDSLRTCADLANRSKHLTLDKHIRKDANIAGKQYDVVINDTGNSQCPLVSTTWDYIITSDEDNPSKMLEVADTAIREWEKLLNDHDLPIE